MAGVVDAQLVALLVEGIEKPVELHPWQGKKGVDTFAEQGAHQRLPAREQLRSHRRSVTESRLMANG